MMHRDLKPDNVLISDVYLPKIADFGESRKFDTAQAEERQEDEGNEGLILTMTMVGTPMYVDLPFSSESASRDG